MDARATGTKIVSLGGENTVIELSSTIRLGGTVPITIGTVARHVSRIDALFEMDRTPHMAIRWYPHHEIDTKKWRQ